MSNYMFSSTALVVQSLWSLHRKICKYLLQQARGADGRWHCMQIQLEFITLGKHAGYNDYTWQHTIYFMFLFLDVDSSLMYTVCHNNVVGSYWADSPRSMLPIYQELIVAGIKIWVFRWAPVVLASLVLFFMTAIYRTCSHLIQILVSSAIACFVISCLVGDFIIRSYYL
jgi:hypothetical protein